MSRRCRARLARCQPRGLLTPRILWPAASQRVRQGLQNGDRTRLPVARKAQLSDTRALTRCPGFRISSLETISMESSTTKPPRRPLENASTEANAASQNGHAPPSQERAPLRE